MNQGSRNFAYVCHSLAACQRHTPSSLAAVIGLSNNDVNALHAQFRKFVNGVNSLRALRLGGNRALLCVSKSMATALGIAFTGSVW